MVAYQEQASRNTERLAAGLGWFSLGLGAAELFAPGAVARLVGMEDRPAWRWLLRSCGLREIVSGLGILFRPDPGNALRTRAAGDALDLATLGVVMGSGAANPGRVAVASAVVVGAAALDIYCSRSLASRSNGRTRMTKSITIHRSPDEVLAFWRHIERLPAWVDYDLSVQSKGGGLFHWVVRAPGGLKVAWEAESRVDPENGVISWQTTDAADIQHSGRIRFEPATGERGTRVVVDFEYLSPGGKLGAQLARLFGVEPGQMVETALRRFKQVLETGDIVRSDADLHAGPHPARPSGRGSAKRAAAH